jgi:hypothetical protein
VCPKKYLCVLLNKYSGSESFEDAHTCLISYWVIRKAEGKISVKPLQLSKGLFMCILVSLHVTFIMNFLMIKHRNKLHHVV